jgi:hypothetical protein
VQQKIIGLISLAAVLGLLMVFYPEGAGAAIIVTLASGAAIYLFQSQSEERRFLTGLFFGALALRLAFGIFLEAFELRSFFGNDATLYDHNGALLVDYWTGKIGWDNNSALQRATSIKIAGWGMNYVTGSLYLIFGRNVFAAQCFCAVVGAATPGLVYMVANNLFRNKRVGKTAAVLVAVFPAFIVWSSQLLKDGLIVFLLVLSILLVLRLQERFSLGLVVLLTFALFGILSLRFYIFYMVSVSVAGSFIIGTSGTRQTLIARTAALVLIGVGLTYFGVSRSAEYDLAEYTDLERIQRSRSDLANSAESGFGEDIDVSTTSGALLAVPVGFVYLMFAPFPWQVSNLRQAITLPEIFVWWAAFPFLLMGIWYAIKHRLRDTLPVLIFSLMLTIAYSIFQGNVGTAYRQRTQIQVFLFMFIAVGWVLWRERREDKKLIAQSRRRRVVPGIGEDARGVS